MYFLQPISQSNEQEFLTVEEERSKLKDILVNIKELPKFMEFKYNNKKVAIEFISGVDNFIKKDNGIICGKLSWKQDKHAFQLRTQGTSHQEELAVKDNQIFEARSYFLIDTNTMVLAYLNERSAPSIASLGAWIYESTKQSDEMSTVWGEVNGIAVKDMINNLVDAEYLGNVEYTMEVPKDLAVEYTNLSEKEYRKLKNQKFIRVKIQLVADKRNLSSFENKDDTRSFFEGLKNNNLIKKIAVKFKPKKADHVREIQLVNNPLNYSIDFEFGDTENSYDSIISKRIESEYSMHKKEISRLYS